jgi:hypothetical protein
MMVHPLDPVYNARNVIDRIFAARDRQKSLAIIDDHAKIWERIIGTRGFTGKRAINAQTQFNRLYDVLGQTTDTNELDPTKLEALEENLDG